MKAINGHIQVYDVWVNGRSIDDQNQHYPVTSNINRDWHNDFKKATEDYFNATVNDLDDEHGNYSEIYQDYHVALYVIDINIKEFENMFDLDFDLEDDRVIESIPYYCDYDFNVVAERVAKFNLPLKDL